MSSPPEGTTSPSWTALREAIPVFDGSDPTLTQVWLGLVESFFAPYPQHAGFLVAAARAKLSGAAAAVMAKYLKCTWPEFEERLLCHFDPVDARAAVQLEIMKGTRYAGGTFLVALDQAVADCAMLGPALAVSILRGLARRVPDVELTSIRFCPTDDFKTTIGLLRETAKKALVCANSRSGWAAESDHRAFAVSAGQGNVVEARPQRATPAEEPRQARPSENSRPSQSKSARRRARAKAQLAKSTEETHVLEAQLQDARFGAAGLDF